MSSALHKSREGGWQGANAARVTTNPGNSNPHSRLLFGNRRNNGGGFRRNNGSDGATQLTVQRQQEGVTTMEQTQTGGITMAEVMKDLRILEEQQKESQMQLQRVRETKQERLAMLARLENELEKVKYSNGQDRAYLHRIREVLAKGRRLHQSCKDGEASSRENLEELSRNLHAALQVKRNLQAMGRHQERVWNNSLQVDTKLQNLLNRAHCQVETAGEELLQIKRQEAEWQQSIQEEESMYQATQQEVVQVRAKCNQVEQRVYAIQTGILEVQKNVESLEHGATEEEKRHHQQVAASEGSLSSHRQAHNEEQTKIQLLRDEIEISKELARKSLSRIQELRVQERQHVDSPPVAASFNQQPQAVDMERIQDSVQVEAKAAQEEMVALNLIREQVEVLRNEHNKNKLESEAKCREVLGLADANKIAQELETTRKETVDNFIAEFAVTKKKCDETNERISIIQNQRNSDLAQATLQLKQADEDLEQIQAARSKAKAQVSRSKKEAEEVNNNDKHSLETGKTPEELKDLVKAAQETLEQLEEAKQVNKEVAQDFDDEKLLVDHNLTMEQMNADIKQLLQDYPILDTLPLQFDAEQTVDEQVETTLEGLRKDCENRINSAIKMDLELRGAQEREEQERVLLQQAAAEEEKRKEETRLKRKKRLQEAETEVERQLREKRQRRKEKKREERLPAGNPAMQKIKEDAGLSAAKPRDLLQSFSQASVEEAISVRGETISNRDLTFIQQNATQEKKVQWIDDRDKQDALTSKSRVGNEDVKFLEQSKATEKSQSTEGGRARALDEQGEAKHRSILREKSHKRTSREERDSKHRSTHSSRSKAGERSSAEAEKPTRRSSKEDQDSKHRSRLSSKDKESRSSKDKESRSSKDKEKKQSERDETTGVAQPSWNKKLPLKPILKEPNITRRSAPTSTGVAGGKLSVKEVASSNQNSSTLIKEKPAHSSKSVDVMKGLSTQRSTDANFQTASNEMSRPSKSEGFAAKEHHQSTSHRSNPAANKDKPVPFRNAFDVSKHHSHDPSRERSTEAKLHKTSKEKGLLSKSEGTAANERHESTSRRSSSAVNKDKPVHSSKSLDDIKNRSNDPSRERSTDAKLHKTSKPRSLPSKSEGAATKENQTSRSLHNQDNSLYSSKSLEGEKHRSRDPSRDRHSEAKLHKPSKENSQPSAKDGHASKSKQSSDASRRDQQARNEKNRQDGDKPSKTLTDKSVLAKRSRIDDHPSAAERPSKQHRRRKPSTSVVGRKPLQMYADDSHNSFL